IAYEQVGGSEQLSTLVAGRTLQSDAGQRPQVVVTLPILVGTDGHERMSQSTGNYIGIDEPPREMYGKVMSLPDSALVNYYVLVSPLTPDEVAEVRRDLDSGALPPMEAKKRLAHSIVTWLYGEADAADAQAYFEQTIQRRETPDEMPEHAVSEPMPLHRLLVDAGMT